MLVGQWLYSGANGHAFVYDNNDVKHFLLNLSLASEWGLQDGYSFNGPIWSVSIEIILYPAFFVLAVSGRLSALASLAIASIGALLAASGAKQLGTGVLCFFLGGATYLTYQRICLLVRSGRSASAVTAAVVLAASAGWVAGLQHLPSTAGQLLLFGGAFPLSVLALALLESAIPDLGKRYRRVGDLTYATYLLHFPIQLTIATAISHLGWKVDYNDPFIFLAYVCVVLLASVYIYFRFELVAQQLLRQRLLRD